MKNNLEILDCTIRDGGYINNWNFDKKLVRETYRSLSKAGVDYVELGYHGTEKYFDKEKYGPFRFCPQGLINEICHGISGSKVALMVDYGKFDLCDLIQYKNSVVSLIRIAFHRDKLKESLEAAKKIKKLGFKVSINLMAFSTYSKEERERLVSLIKDMQLDYLYVADTYGSMFPNQVADIFGSLFKLKHIKLGFHPHNNLQMAFANILAAMDIGVHIIDGAVYGMGRGAGNLNIESILSYLQLIKPQKYNVIPVLSLIDRYYLDLHKKNTWGYELAYMLSGIHSCHPDYAKSLVERKEYDIEDIWKILEFINVNNPIGYKKEFLEGILKKCLFKKSLPFCSTKQNKVTKSINKKFRITYLNRHTDADFLILANGPSLSEYRGEIDKFIKKYKPIVIGVNYHGNLFKAQYHAFNNKRRFIDYIDTVDKESRLLIGQYISPSMIKDYVDTKYETIYYLDNSTSSFDINDGVISSNCRTISILSIGIAIVMGARRIFVAGLDGYMWPNNINSDGNKGKLHFYFEKDETENFDFLRDRHLGNLRYLEQIDEYMFKHGKEGVHIITPTSYAKFYKGIENYIINE